MRLDVHVFGTGFFCFPWFFPYELFIHGLDEFFHPCGAFLFHLIGNMAVHIQGKGCGGMTQILLYRFDIITGADGCHGIGVPEIVEAGFRAADLRHDLLEVLQDRVPVQVLPQLIGENKSLSSQQSPYRSRFSSC